MIGLKSAWRWWQERRRENEMVTITSAVSGATLRCPRKDLPSVREIMEVDGWRIRGDRLLSPAELAEEPNDAQ